MTGSMMWFRLRRLSIVSRFALGISAHGRDEDCRRRLLCVGVLFLLTGGLSFLGVDGAFEGIVFTIGGFAFLFCLVHRLFAPVFLFLKRGNDMFEVVGRQQLMRDALAAKGAGLDMVFDESLAQGDHRFLDAAAHGDILRVGALIGLFGLL